MWLVGAADNQGIGMVIRLGGQHRNRCGYLVPWTIEESFFGFSLLHNFQNGNETHSG